MIELNEAQRCSEQGDALRASGQSAAAIAAYERGLAADPNNIALHISLGTLCLTARADRAGAAASYRRALGVNPAHREARIRLAHVLKLSAEFSSAAAVLHSLAADDPGDPIVFKEFGRLYFEQHELDAAHASFEHALQLRPGDADAHHWLANIEHLRGNAEAASEHYRRTIELKSLLRIPATKNPADFTVLLLFAPGNANTPHDALIKMADYESCFLLLLPEATYDVNALRRRAHVVVNLISDVDWGHAILPAAETLVELLGLPVVNHPRTIRKTDRASVAARLSGIPRCRVPQVRYVDAQTVAACVGREQWAFPVLLRVAGTHGGEDFEKVDDMPAVDAFVARHPGARLYVTQYVDYRSADGFFRKYRFFFIDDAILPYHLAIDDTWKVHHVTTNMADQPWMQQEEAAFLSDPASVFTPQHFTALEAIRTAIGLDFFGIDCAIDQAGRLLVFEVNASMLVHQNNERFPYKARAIERITTAFAGMLRRRARPGET